MFQSAHHFHLFLQVTEFITYFKRQVALLLLLLEVIFLNQSASYRKSLVEVFINSGYSLGSI